MTQSRTFRAPDMRAALEQVQRKLGPEALVVSVRQVPPRPAWKVWRKDQVEVIAVPAKEVAAEAQPILVQEIESRIVDTRRSLETVADQPPDDQRDLDSNYPVSEREEIDLHTIHNSRVSDSSSSWGPRLVALYQHLLRQGLDEQRARNSITMCAQALSRKDLENSQRVQEYVSLHLEANLRTRSPAALDSDRLICFIGARGSGKTSAVAKLIGHQKNVRMRNVVWICADTITAGAIPEAQVYSSSLGVPLELAYTPDELAAKVEKSNSADVIVVDLPGCSRRKEDDVVVLGELLNSIPDRTTYLVLDATCKQDDLIETASTLGLFNPQGLVMTKMDDTRTYGNMINLACRTKIPLAYSTFSPGGLRGLRLSTARSLVRALMEGKWQA
jgi:flagellar biosynthesis protein FlhF